MIEPLDYKMTDAELETAIADKLLETKDWFAIKGLMAPGNWLEFRAAQSPDN